MNVPVKTSCWMAALVALAGAGIYEDPQVTKGLDYLMSFLPAENLVRRETYFEYGHYYAAQAMWLAGGQRWAKWYPAVRDELVARQRPDGSWANRFTDAKEDDPLVATPWAAAALAIGRAVITRQSDLPGNRCPP